MSEPGLTETELSRLKKLADELGPGELDALIAVVRKEQSWTFLRSYLSGFAVFVASTLATLIFFRDTISAFFRSLLSTN